MKVVGLDCGKQFVTWHALTRLPRDVKRHIQSSAHEALGTSPRDLAKLVQMGDVFAIEPTGTYHRVFLDHLLAAGREVRLVNSWKLRHWVESHGLPTKSDRTDAAALACYCLDNLGRDRAFVPIPDFTLRDTVYRMESSNRTALRLRQQLGLNLVRECPEWVATHESSGRDWLEPEPPALWRYLAGETVRNGKRRDAECKATVGGGISGGTRLLAVELCLAERHQFLIEHLIAQMLGRPAYHPYLEVYRRWGIQGKLAATLLTQHYPFDRFLDDGLEVIDRLVGPYSSRPDKLTKRNRSLDGWMASNGLGRKQVQSGQSLVWSSWGPVVIRSAWWQWAKTSVVMRRGNLDRWMTEGDGRPWEVPAVVEHLALNRGVSPVLAGCWLRYEASKATIQGEGARLMAIARHASKGIYRALLLAHKHGALCIPSAHESLENHTATMHPPSELASSAGVISGVE